MPHQLFFLILILISSMFYNANGDVDITELTSCPDKPGDCIVGNFTFSALFYSYLNPLRLCGECGNDGPVCCDETVNTSCIRYSCNLRLVYFLQPYGSNATNVTLVPLDPPLYPVSNDESGEKFAFNEGNNTFLLNRSNPFTAMLRIWTGRIQFYIVTYDRYRVTNRTLTVLDRFLIDLQLNISSNFTERATYYGIHNVSQFDLSFRVQCSEDYYGPRCDKFCLGIEKQFMCDSEGNIVCVNENRDPGTDCLECLPRRNSSTNCTTCLSGGDPANDCRLPTQGEPGGSVPVRGAVIGGAVAGAVILLILIVLIIIIFMIVCVYCIRKKPDKEGYKEAEEPPKKSHPDPHVYDVDPLANSKEVVDEAVEDSPLAASGEHTNSELSPSSDPKQTLNNEAAPSSDLFEPVPSSANAGGIYRDLTPSPGSKETHDDDEVGPLADSEEIAAV